MICSALHAWLCRSHANRCLTMAANSPRSALGNRRCWPVRRNSSGPWGCRRCPIMPRCGGSSPQGETAPAGAPVDGDRAVVPARDSPALAHGGSGFHGLCPCPGSPVLPAAGRQTLPGPDLAAVVGGGVEPTPWCWVGRLPTVDRVGTMWNFARWWHKRWPDCPSRACWPLGATIRRPTTAGGAKTWASSASFHRWRDGYRVVRGHHARRRGHHWDRAVVPYRRGPR